MLKRFVKFLGIPFSVLLVPYLTVALLTIAASSPLFCSVIPLESKISLYSDSLYFGLVVFIAGVLSALLGVVGYLFSRMGERYMKLFNAPISLFIVVVLPYNLYVAMLSNMRDPLPNLFWLLLSAVFCIGLFYLVLGVNHYIYRLFSTKKLHSVHLILSGFTVASFAFLLYFLISFLLSNFCVPVFSGPPPLL